MKNPEEILKIYKVAFLGVNKLINEELNRFSFNSKSIFLVEKQWTSILNNWKADIIDYQIVIFLFTWQYTKTIYRFDNTIYESLTKNTINCKLPTDILFRLPYHCLYIDIQEKIISGLKIHGFWVKLDYLIDTNKYVINFLMNGVTENEDMFQTQPLPLYLENGDINDTIEKSFNAFTDRYEKISGEKHGSNKEKRYISSIEYLTLLKTFLPLALYICSEEPDIICHEKQQKEHQYSVKTRHGQKLFPAPKVKIFNVGDEIAKKIQEVNDYEAGNNSVRAHIRQAHWHGYWTGKGRTEFKYNWLHPVLVNIEK